MTCRARVLPAVGWLRPGQGSGAAGQRDTACGPGNPAFKSCWCPPGHFTARATGLLPGARPL